MRSSSASACPTAPIPIRCARPSRAWHATARSFYACRHLPSRSTTSVRARSSSRCMRVAPPMPSRARRRRSSGRGSSRPSRGAGIEMPYAQYDIHLRDLDAVRAILNRVAEERAARPGVNGEAENLSMSAASAGEQRRRAPGYGPRSVLAIDALTPLVALLGFDREGRNRACIEALQPYGLARLLAIAVGAVLDAGERRIDLSDELALAVAGTQLQRAVRLGRGAIGKIGVLGRNPRAGQPEVFFRLADDFFLPGHKLLAEVEAVTLVHERLVLGRPVVGRQYDGGARGSNRQRLVSRFSDSSRLGLGFHLGRYCLFGPGCGFRGWLLGRLPCRCRLGRFLLCSLAMMGLPEALLPPLPLPLDSVQR